MLIEIHLIQSFSPSNLNRDDTGNPKDAMFGGERRVRISSQAQKRPVRLSPYFQEQIATGVGIRSKTLVTEVGAALIERGFSDEAAKQWAMNFVEYLSKLDAKSEAHKTSVLLYLSQHEKGLIVEKLIQLAQQNSSPDDSAFKKAFDEFAKQVKGRTSAPDIAMFGRMLADAPILSMDAACQVAHAISTHQAVTDFDYFTAVDDLQPEDTSGASMIGLTPFTSATFYRYARVDWEQLVRNLGGDAALARRTVDGFLRALVFALPTGKQNTFASHHTPDFLLAVVRPDSQGWSLANAFEKSVRAHRGSGYVEPSIERLIEHWRNQENIFRLKSPRAIAVLNPAGVSLDGFSREDEANITTVAGTLPDWLNAVLRPLPEGG